MPLENSKNNDFKFRIDGVTANLLERVKSYTNLTKSSFIRESIREKAEALILEHEQTLFTRNDWKLFFALLDFPPEPTPRMKKAAKKYKAVT